MSLSKRRTRITAGVVTVFGFGVLALLVLSSILPRLNERAESPRAFCSSNLRQIGLALKMYAIENHGLFPPTLGALLTTEDISADVFICPQDRGDTPAPSTQPAEAARQLDDPSGHHCSYFYAAAGLNNDTADPDDVLAFESPQDHGGNGLNILFADGHVDWSAISERPGDGGLDYARFWADFRAGKRPLRDPATPSTRPALPTKRQ